MVCERKNESRIFRCRAERESNPGAKSMQIRTRSKPAVRSPLTRRLSVSSIGRAARAYRPPPPPLPALVPTSLRPQPDRPPDRKLINECKRANVVDKFNKIVHAQLVSPGVNTFLENVSSLSLCSGIRNFSPLPLNRLGRVSVTAAWITREIILPRVVSLSNNFIVFDKIFCFFFFFIYIDFLKRWKTYPN